MAKKKTNPTKARAKSSATARSFVEWVAGVTSLPRGTILDQPELELGFVVWMGSNGQILGQMSGSMESIFDEAAIGLRDTIEAPLVGLPHRPDRIRSASLDLLEALRPEFPEIELVHGVTPELDPLLELMRPKCRSDEFNSYFHDGSNEGDVSAFFEAAAALYRAAPWKIVPDDTTFLSISIPELEVRDSVLSVIGQLGRTLGIALFSTVDDVNRFAESLGGKTLSGDEPAPKQISLTFDSAEELPEGRLEEVEEFAWTIANKRAYPTPLAVNSDKGVRLANDAEYLILELCARAVTLIIKSEMGIREAWRRGASFASELSVRARGKDYQVKISSVSDSAVYGWGPEPVSAKATELLARFAAISQHENPDQEIDPEAREELESELLDRLAASREGRVPGISMAAQMVMDFAANYSGRNVATLDLHTFKEILLHYIPRKVTFNPDDIPEFFVALRGFFEFLKRELGASNTDTILDCLNDGTLAVFQREVTQSDKHGLMSMISNLSSLRESDMETGLQSILQMMLRNPPPGLGLPGILGVGGKKNKGANSKKGRGTKKPAKRSTTKNRD
jgi:hypothetical protein